MTLGEGITGKPAAHRLPKSFITALEHINAIADGGRQDVIYRIGDNVPLRLMGALSDRKTIYLPKGFADKRGLIVTDEKQAFFLVALIGALLSEATGSWKDKASFDKPKAQDFTDDEENFRFGIIDKERISPALTKEMMRLMKKISDQLFTGWYVDGIIYYKEIPLPKPDTLPSEHGSTLSQILFETHRYRGTGGEPYFYYGPRDKIGKLFVKKAGMDRLAEIEGLNVAQLVQATSQGLQP